MRIDLYTKTILTLITLLLAIVALKSVVQPTPVLAQPSMAGVQFSASDNYITFLDAKSGDIWKYYPPKGQVEHFKLTRLGAPLGQ